MRLPSFDSFLDIVKAVKWLRIGDWEAPVLYEDVYCRGLRHHVSAYTRTRYYCKKFLHIKPITYITLEDYQPFADAIREKIQKDNTYLAYLTRNFKEEAAFHNTIGTKLEQIRGNLEKLSNAKLGDIFEDYVKSLLRMTPYSYVFSWGEEYIFGRLVRDIIARHCQHKKPEIGEYFLKLTPPPSEPKLAMIECQDALLDLVNTIRNEGNLLSLFAEETATIEKALQKYPGLHSQMMRYVKEYGWLSTRHFLGNPIRVKDIIEQIRGIIDVDVATERSNQKQAREKSEREFAETVAKLGIHGDDLKIVTEIREHVYLKSYRKELMGKVAFQLRPLFEEIGRRMDLSYIEFVNLTLNEIRHFFKTGEVTSREKIEERQRGYAYVIIDDKTRLVVGDELRRLRENIVTRFETKIKGLTANLGKVKGIVKVILKKEDTNKLETGDILVTDMTNPDIAMAAYRCSAIITDKGGMLCHAAILSRELNIPCIVGTGNATQVLKDGDTVEVDATNGIVRILEVED